MSEITVEDLEIEPGTAVRLDGTNGRLDSRTYITVVNGLVLQVEADRLSEIAPDFAHFKIAHGLNTKTVDSQEAFEFLLGEYEPEIEYFCLGCGTTTTEVDTKPCNCPVGCEINDVEWPTIDASA